MPAGPSIVLTLQAPTRESPRTSAAPLRDEGEERYAAVLRRRQTRRRLCAIAGGEVEIVQEPIDPPRLRDAPYATRGKLIASRNCAEQDGVAAGQLSAGTQDGVASQPNLASGVNKNHAGQTNGGPVRVPWGRLRGFKRKRSLKESVAAGDEAHKSGGDAMRGRWKNPIKSWVLYRTRSIRRTSRGDRLEPRSRRRLRDHAGNLSASITALSGR